MAAINGLLKHGDYVIEGKKTPNSMPLQITLRSVLLTRTLALTSSVLELLI